MTSVVAPPDGVAMGLEPARVLVMVDYLLAGGAERLAVELACALDRSRFEPHVLVTRGTGPLEQLLVDAAVPYTILGRSSRLGEGRAWRRAHRLLREHDLLHSHKYGSNVWGALLARTAHRPLVAHEHNFSASAGRTRTIIDRSWIGPAAARVVCVSDSVADVERRIGLPESQLVVVPNGVHLEAALDRAAARIELGLPQTSWVVGIVGRLRPEKAHEVALESLARLVRDGRDITLCIVGDGPCEEDLRALASRLGLTARNLVWAGERRDAARLAGAFDAGLICSHWEGMPLAALETMAAGVPLVATAVGALPDLVAGGCGLLADPGDDAAIADAIAYLHDDPAHAEAIGNAGRTRVQIEYDFGRMVQRIEAIYTAVLEEAAEKGDRRDAPRTRYGGTRGMEDAAA